MKLTQLVPLTAVAVVLALATGCKHPHPGVTPLGGQSGATTGLGENTNLPPGGAYSSSNPSGESATGIPANPANAHDGWTPHPDILQADTVYFDFDSSVVKSSQQSKLAAVADYLKSNPSAAVRIEGHCDERGTEEYNRSLGERRALALREALAHMGVDPTRVDTVSYGKDRPADPGHDEAAWSKNRRGEFVVLTPP